MTTLREAIEQTVAILGPEAPLCSGCVEEWTEALRILNDALAEQPAEQEPVAWMVMNGVCNYQLFWSKHQADALCAEMQKRHDLSGSLASFHVQPLYTAPQPAKQPQEPSAFGVLFAVEEAIRNGDCPSQIERAFDEYEAERKAAIGIRGDV